MLHRDCPYVPLSILKSKDLLSNEYNYCWKMPLTLVRVVVQVVGAIALTGACPTLTDSFVGPIGFSHRCLVGFRNF
jgi:hypothetical protein